MPPEAAGQRLDAWLAERARRLARAPRSALIEAGAVLGRRRAARPKSYACGGGERVERRPIARPPARCRAAPSPRIVWEDDDLLVVDKPAGLVVHPAPGHRGTTLVELLAERAAAAGSRSPSTGSTATPRG